MRRVPDRQLQRRAFTLAELSIAVALLTVVTGGIFTATLCMHRCTVAVLDFSNAQDDQIRISDYLALDIRRSVGVNLNTPGVVAITLPNFYQADGTPSPPVITSTTGWPAQRKKKKKHRHQDIIMSETATYDPAHVQLVKYYQGAAGRAGADTTKFYREVNGTATVIANDVADFTLSINDDQTVVKTQIKFATRFRPFANSAPNAASTLYQTTLIRNFQLP